MGFGKTTALREYVHAKHLDPIWLSLLGSGGSLAYCWERMNAQINCFFSSRALREMKGAASRRTQARPRPAAFDLRRPADASLREGKHPTDLLL